MVTTVGNQSRIDDLLENFILLEHDAIAAYDTVIERLETPEYKQKIAEFKSDHERHMADLRALAQKHGADVPIEGDMKGMLTTGKVKLADMMGGDGAILRAMATNESDTVSAYDKGCHNDCIPAEDRALFTKALEDERRHKEWMERTAEAA